MQDRTPDSMQLVSPNAEEAMAVHGITLLPPELRTRVLKIIYEGLDDAEAMALRTHSLFNAISLEKFFDNESASARIKQYKLLKIWSINPRTVTIDENLILRSIQHPDASLADQMNGLAVIARNKNAPLEMMSDDRWMNLIDDLSHENQDVRHDALQTLTVSMAVVTHENGASYLPIIMSGLNKPLSVEKTMNVLVNLSIKFTPEQNCALLRQIIVIIDNKNWEVCRSFHETDGSAYTALALIASQLNTTQIRQLISYIIRKTISSHTNSAFRAMMSIVKALASKLLQNEITPLMQAIKSKLSQTRADRRTYIAAFEALTSLTLITTDTGLVADHLASMILALDQSQYATSEADVSAAARGSALKSLTILTPELSEEQKKTILRVALTCAAHNATHNEPNENLRVDSYKFIARNLAVYNPANHLEVEAISLKGLFIRSNKSQLTRTILTGIASKLDLNQSMYLFKKIISHLANDDEMIHEDALSAMEVLASKFTPAQVQEIISAAHNNSINANRAQAIILLITVCPLISSVKTEDIPAIIEIIRSTIYNGKLVELSAKVIMKLTLKGALDIASEFATYMDKLLTALLLTAPSIQATVRPLPALMLSHLSAHVNMRDANKYLEPLNNALDRLDHFSNANMLFSSIFMLASKCSKTIFDEYIKKVIQQLVCGHFYIEKHSLDMLKKLSYRLDAKLMKQIMPAVAKMIEPHQRHHEEIHEQAEELIGHYIVINKWDESLLMTGPDSRELALNKRLQQLKMINQHAKLPMAATAMSVELSSADSSVLGKRERHFNPF